MSDPGPAFEIEIRGRRLAVRPGLENGRVRGYCDDPDPTLRPLARVLETAWLYGPARFLQSVISGQGQSFEGVVSYGFSREYPEEIPDGVLVSFLDEELNLSEEELLRAVAAWTSGLLDHAEQNRLPVEGVAEIRETLDHIQKSYGP